MCARATFHDAGKVSGLPSGVILISAYLVFGSRAMDLVHQEIGNSRYSSMIFLSTTTLQSNIRLFNTMPNKLRLPIDDVQVPFSILDTDLYKVC